MHGLDLVNTAIFVGAALVMLGIFSSLIATRAGAPLLLVFLVVGMLAGQDGPGGIVFNDYSADLPRRHDRALDHPLRRRPQDAARRSSAACSRRRCFSPPSASSSPRRWPARVGWLVLDLDPGGALLLGTIIASTDAAAVFFLLRTGGLRLQHRVGATLEIESGTNDPIAVFLVIILTQFILAGGDTPASELAMELVMEAVIGAALRPRRRLRAGGDAERPRHARRPAPALRGGGRGHHLGLHLARRRQRAARRLHRRPRHGQPAGARLSLHRRLPRRGDLALPDRDVPHARPPRHPEHALGLCAAGPPRRRWS